MLNFCDFIQVFVLTTNHHINVIITQIRSNFSVFLSLDFLPFRYCTEVRPILLNVISALEGTLYDLLLVNRHSYHVMKGKNKSNY